MDSADQSQPSSTGENPAGAAPVSRHKSAIDVRGGEALSRGGRKALLWFWILLAFGSIATVMYFQSVFHAKLPSKSTNQAAQ